MAYVSYQSKLAKQSHLQTSDVNGGIRESYLTLLHI